MDAKSLAKSKRAHSQHLNKKHHPNPKAKAPVVAARAEGNASKPSGKQTGQKSRQFHGLPSNWDRYEEEFDEGSEDRSLSSTTAPASDVIMPKSKGADFSYLISEAQSQSSSNVEYFTSFEDALPEFDQAVSSMLSVRREGILSWIVDDNFIVDDNATAGCEASFLSMDLHALAEQLEKLDVSRRLFIEEDLLPPELCAGGNDTARQKSEQPEMVASGNSKQSSDESAFHRHTDVDKSIDLKIENMSGTATNNYASFQRHPRQGVELVDQERKDTLSTTNSNSSVPTFTCQPTELVDPVKDDSKQLDDTALRGILDSMEQLKDIPIEDSAEKTLKFEALAAEAELDMLLNSFGEANLLDSSSGISKYPTSSFPLAPSEDSNSFLEGFTAASKSSKTVLMKVNLNDTIDDLLGETLDSKNQKNELVLQEGTTISSGLPSLSVSSNPGSKVLDDFESWLDTI